MNNQNLNVPNQVDIIPYLNTGRSFQSDNEFDYITLQRKLIEHFTIQWNFYKIRWPKSFTNQQKEIYGPPTVIQRSQHDLSNVLYGKPSDFRRKSRSSDYIYKIGLGLFSTISYDIDDQIADFDGEVIDYAEYQRRTNVLHQGGYILQITHSRYLDCHQKCMLGECKASYANCWKDCKDIRRNIRGKDLENAKISICNNKIRLIATKAILPNTEKAWNYGNCYVFPSIDEVDVDEALVT
jgi:hypothetical protein